MLQRTITQGKAVTGDAILEMMVSGGLFKCLQRLRNEIVSSADIWGENIPGRGIS